MKKGTDEKNKRQKIFGENLERIRRERGISRREIAKALEMNETSLGAYFQGRTFPPVDRLIKLSEVLNRSVADLIDENPKIESSRVFFARLKRALEIVVAAGFEFPNIEEKPIELKLKSKDIFKTDAGIRTEIPLESLKFETPENFVKVIEAIEIKAIEKNISFKDAIQNLIDTQ